MKKLFFAILLWLPFLGLKSQAPIHEVVYDYQLATTGTAYTHGGVSYRFGNQSGTTNNLQVVTGILFNNQTFLYNLFINGNVFLRRTNTSSNNQRCLVWMESSGTASNVSVHPPYLDSMELFLSGRTINCGTDNLFGNQGDGSGNNNNIERVDWIAPLGLRASGATQSGFAIFERGEDNQHDPFCIAAILALDSNGAPAKYGPLLRVLPSHYGNLPNSQIQTSIFRKEGDEPFLYRTATALQKRGGVFISLQHLGIANRQTVYGYSLFANDLPPSATPADLVDYNNQTFFPRNTPSNTGEGGIDLIAITGLFNTSDIYVTLPVNLLSFTAVHRQGSVELNWKLSDKTSCQSLTVERSANGVDWEIIAANLSPGSNQYLDRLAVPGTYFYRLQVTEVDGSRQRTPVKSVKVTQPILPALVAEKRPETLLLSFPGAKHETAAICITDFAGRRLARREVVVRPGTNRVEIPILPFYGPVLISVSTPSWRLEKKIMFR